MGRRRAKLTSHILILSRALSPSLSRYEREVVNVLLTAQVHRENVRKSTRAVNLVCRSSFSPLTADRGGRLAHGSHFSLPVVTDGGAHSAWTKVETVWSRFVEEGMQFLFFTLERTRTIGFVVGSLVVKLKSRIILCVFLCVIVHRQYKWKVFFFCEFIRFLCFTSLHFRFFI